MEYIEFKRFNGEKANLLKANFLSQLKVTEILHFKKLYEIINKEKDIKIKIHNCNYENMYVIMVTCFRDSILIKYGRENNLPRGFPILWIPNKLIKFYGFYPKFDNDNREQEYDESDFKGVEKLSFFKKWSGYLGQVCIFNYNNKLFWWCCSKNSADYNSEYIQNCRRLFSKYINFENLKNLSFHNLHICAEIMANFDQKHGARVLKEIPVITSLAMGSLVYLDNIKKSIITNNMVDFLDHEQLVKFCISNNLPCDSAIIVNKNISNFISDLSKERDFITDFKLEQLIIKYKSDINIFEGNVKHSEILGDTLEGLVIISTKKNDETFTKKYKFPNYTVRTMALRNLIENYGHNNLVNNSVAKMEFNKFVESWCISNEGKKYWFDFLKVCSLLLKKNKDFLKDDNIGLHIRISDYVQNITLENFFIEFIYNLK